MELPISRAAEILKVDKQLIKKWAYYFSEYLTASANPKKGKTRLFSIADVLVFAYVSNHWEGEPDFECIKIGLNAREHYEYPYNEFATVLTPIFREIPHDIEERLASAALVVALSEFTDLYFIANSYKSAGDVLVESAIENENAYQLIYPIIYIIYPIIYNYRHSIELYLKDSITNRQTSHSLTRPLSELPKVNSEKLSARSFQRGYRLL